MAETFSVTPQMVWESSSVHNVLISTFESGREQRRYKGAKPRVWKLSFEGTWAKIASIETFFNARKGSYEAFNWTPPGGSATTVRFKENSLDITHHGQGLWGSCEVTIQEVL